MKRFVIALLLMLSAGSLAWPQLVTRARIPDPETRRRMGLDLQWHVRLPMQDEHDGLFSVQVIPWRLNYPQLLVQTRAGWVYLMDGETGDTIWKRQPSGSARTGMLPAAYNKHSIYIVRGDWLDIFNRENGRQELYFYNTRKEKMYGVRLRYVQLPLIPGLPPLPPPRTPPIPISPPIAAPVADEDNFYWTSGTKITCYSVPDYQYLATRPPPEPKKGEKQYKRDPNDPPPDPPQPKYRWMMILAKSTCEQFPVVSTSQVGVLERDGTFMSLDKTEDKIHFRFKAEGRLVSGAAQYDETAYFGSEDQKLYAMDLENGRVLWKFLAPGVIVRKPNCNDRDVYVRVEDSGLYRLDRDNGRDVWVSKQAQSFLAANRMFVYARDRQGKLLLHDYIRGTVMASYDMSDWQVNIANEWTDRIYVGNHDGQIMCMHHHDYPRFQRMKSLDWFVKRQIKKDEKGKEKKEDKDDKDK
jgi:outer membrane protein assembly factor BamB